MAQYVETAESQAFVALLGEKRGEITEAARALIRIAEDCAYTFYLCRSHSSQAEEFCIADHNMLSQAYALTEHDREVLADLARAAKAASESLDKEDFETPAGFHISVANFRYYGMISGMIEKALKPTNPSEINSAQFDLWREYGEWCARQGRT